MHADHNVEKDFSIMRAKIESKTIKNTQAAFYLETKSIGRKEKKEDEEEKEKEGWYDT